MNRVTKSDSWVRNPDGTPGVLLTAGRAGLPPSFRLDGVCRCGWELWRWSIAGAVLSLTCTGCGQLVEFNVSLPLISVLKELKKLAREARKEVNNDY